MRPCCTKGTYCLLMAGRFLLFLPIFLSLPAGAQQQPGESKTRLPYVASASDEAQLAIKRIKPAPGLKIDLWAECPYGRAAETTFRKAQLREASKNSF